MGTPKNQSGQKNERLEARVTAEFKNQLLLACSIAGKSVTDFMVEHLGHAAAGIIVDHTQWKLAQQDSEAFVEALLNPRPASQRLRRAARGHRQALGD